MLVMLDLDNTLADREGAVSAWIREFSKENALPPDAVAWFLDADQDGYAARRSVFDTFQQRYELAGNLDELLAVYQRRVVELVELCNGAIAGLSALRVMGAKLAIVTNGSAGQQHAKIDRLGLRPLVDAVCVSGEVGVSKPDPRMFELAAERCGCELRGSWMVGDSALHDVVGGQQVGANTAWLHRGRTWPASSPSPTAVIASLAELVAVIALHRDQSG